MIIRRDDITAREVRSKLREPNNLSDDLFVSFCVSLGVLNSGFKSDQLREVKRIVKKEPTAKFGTRKYGSGQIYKNKYKEFLNVKRVLPEKQFNPMS